MGIGIRIFLVNDDDSIRRFPLTRFERLIRRDPEERLRRFAGNRVRCAEVALKLEQRKPIEIVRIQYFIVSFDSEGRIDQTEQEKAWHLTAEMVSSPLIKRGQNHVIDAKHRFAKRRYDYEYRWTPTAEIEAAIMDAIFGK